MICTQSAAIVPGHAGDGLSEMFTFVSYSKRVPRRSTGPLRNRRPPSSGSPLPLGKWNREQRPLRAEGPEPSSASMRPLSSSRTSPRRLPRVPMATRGFVCRPPHTPAPRPADRKPRAPGACGKRLEATAQRQPGTARLRRVPSQRSAARGGRVRGGGAGRASAAAGQRPASRACAERAAAEGRRRGRRRPAALRGVRGASGARVLAGLRAPPPPAGFVPLRGFGGSRRVLGVARAEVGSGGFSRTAFWGL